MITRRDELCNRIHMDVQDLIVAGCGLIDRLFIPLITENKGDAVCCANYLRSVGYKVEIHEEMRDMLYELNVTWK